MGNETLALVGCHSYDRALIEDKVERAFFLLGGPEAVVGEGESVFIKPNALLPVAANEVATTHPEVVRAVVEQIKKVTDDMTIGDSPGGPFNQTLLKKTYDRTGLTRVAEETGASLCYDTASITRVCPDGKTMKSFLLCRAMAQSDRLISISKYKTHLLMNVTGAIKNMFGAVPGMTKFTYHAMFHEAEEFADLLVDVLLASAPDFHVVDAVVGMDGNGSRKGNSKKLGIIVAGAEPFAIDTLMAHLTCQDPHINLPLRAAINRGLCSGRIGDIDVIGDRSEALMVRDFQLPTKRSIIKYLPAFFMRKYGNWMSDRPYPNPARCTGCRKCAEICPVEAIDTAGGIANIEYGSCIRCYCCLELCEQDAIDLERPLLMRIIGAGDQQ